MRVMKQMFGVLALILLVTVIILAIQLDRVSSREIETVDLSIITDLKTDVLARDDKITYLEQEIEKRNKRIVWLEVQKDAVAPEDIVIPEDNYNLESTFTEEVK